MIKAKKKKITIDPKTPISDLTEQYPQVTDILIYDYGLHCVGCIVAEFETLEEGAKAHGMDDKMFEKMIKDINKRINEQV